MGGVTLFWHPPVYTGVRSLSRAARRRRCHQAVAVRPLDDQLKLECLYGYSIMGDPEIIERRDAFLESR